MGRNVLCVFVLGVLLCAMRAGAAVVPCVVATLHNYDASGFACTEGSLLFSNFSFSDSGSAALPDDKAVEVEPLRDGFDFEGPFTASAGSSLDVILRYTISELALCPSCGITGASLAMAGFGSSGGGAVDIADTLCLGRVFTPDGACAGKLVSLNVFDNAGVVKAGDSLTGNAPFGVVGVVKDITLEGGGGSASVSLIDQEASQFSVAPAPEMGTLLLALAGGGMMLAGRSVTKRGLARRRQA
jgi:hypothetical protein